MTVEDPSATRVHGHLTIANIAHVRQESLGCDRVITVCQEPVTDNVNVPYEWYDLADGEDSGYGGECSYELFAAAAHSLAGAFHRGEDVLIHCHRGQSRSASVAIAAEAMYMRWPWHGVQHEFQKQRPQIDPDETLVQFGKRFVAEHA